MELPLVRGGQRRSSPHQRSPARGRRPEAPVAAGAGQVPRHTDRHHVRFADRHPDGVLMRRHGRSQSGQVMVLVALSLIALIGSAALVLLAGSAEWQKNQLQQVADQAALEATLQIGVGCDAAKAKAVIDTADTSIGKQRAPAGPYSGVVGGPCATGYSGSQTFAGGALSAVINYPYRKHQQQVEVVLTLNLPISFGGVVGKTSTALVRRAVAQALPGSVPALSATTLSCTGGQVNVAGSVLTQNAITLSGGCAAL